MNIDFASVARALKEINYSGYLTIEADSYLKKFNEDTIYGGVKDLALSAKRLAEIYDNI
jgi:sugar phosphate isomerase/epimerase